MGATKPRGFSYTLLHACANLRFPSGGLSLSGVVGRHRLAMAEERLLGRPK